MKKLQVLLLALLIAAMAACGSNGDDIEEVDIGPNSIRVTMVTIPGADCYVDYHLASPGERCFSGTCTWNFDPPLEIIVRAFDGTACVFDSWGGDCAFADQATTCTLFVNQRYNVTATFVAVP